MNHQLITLSDMKNDTRFKEFHLYNDSSELQHVVASQLVDKIKDNNCADKKTVIILPVGPMDYKIVAHICNKEQVSCKNLVVINMDEFLDKDGRLISKDHPMSFRAYMDREFYDLLKDELKVPEQNRIFPDPENPGFIAEIIEKFGGVDLCIAGFGIDCHVAYNEPATEEELQGKKYSELTTRVVNITRETITQTAMSTGGNLDGIPKQAITVGMVEILGAGEIWMTFMRTWQPAVVRKALYGPIVPDVPASYLQNHPNIKVYMIQAVAEVPPLLPG